MQTTVKIDVNGRILVPADVRKTFGWTTGVKLTLKSSVKGVILTTKKDKIKQVLAKFRHNTKELPTVDSFLKFRKQDQN